VAWQAEGSPAQAAQRVAMTRVVIKTIIYETRASRVRESSAALIDESTDRYEHLANERIPTNGSPRQSAAILFHVSTSLLSRMDQRRSGHCGR